MLTGTTQKGNVGDSREAAPEATESPRNEAFPPGDSGPDRTALEVSVGFDKLKDLLDDWVDDIVNGD